MLLNIMDCVIRLCFFNIYRVDHFFGILCKEYLQMINIIIVVRDMAGNLVNDTFEFFELFDMVFRRLFPVKPDNRSFQSPREIGNLLVPIFNHIFDDLYCLNPCVFIRPLHPDGLVIHGYHTLQTLSLVHQPMQERLKPVQPVHFPV